MAKGGSKCQEPTIVPASIRLFFTTIKSLVLSLFVVPMTFCFSFLSFRHYQASLSVLF